MPPRPTRKPAIVSHRAHGGTHPENTLLGIQAALDDGCEAIEIDVRRTVDGGLILMHDETFTRTVGDRRVASQVTLGEATALQVLSKDPQYQPQPVPTLEDALKLIDGRAAIVIDFVDEPIADDLIALVKRMNAGTWTWWTSHNPKLAERLAAEVPGSRTYLGWMASDGRYASPVDAIEVCVRRGLHGLNVDHRAVDPTLLKLAHYEDLEVGVWTVNDPKRMTALVAMGVDLLTTDYPRAALLVRERTATPEAPRTPTLRWQHRG